MSGQVTVVVGGQFGSEGKGAVAGWLSAKDGRGLAAVRVAGPNAGHTVWAEGREWKFRHLPVAAVTNDKAKLILAAGSEIDIQVLESEINDVESAGIDVMSRLTVDRTATVITSVHKTEETPLTTSIGSTGKGIGAARAARIMRRAETIGETKHLNFEVNDTQTYLKRVLEGGWRVLIEGTQGYGLGLHSGFYPYCTSSDCRAVDFIAMAGISPWARYVAALRVWVVLRTRPIRVGGDSGPLKDETTWEELGLPIERTTVTNKIRRVGGWDASLARNAIVANGGGSGNNGVKVAVTMMDHVFPELRDQSELHPKAWTWIGQKETELETQISLVGTGPRTLVEVG